MITEASNNFLVLAGGGGVCDVEVKESTNNIRVSQSGRHIFVQTEYSVDFAACGKVLWGKGKKGEEERYKRTKETSYL